MKPLEQHPPDLTGAFRSFERAARRLEQRHAALQDEVEGLESRLGDSNRRLATVLDTLEHGVGVIARDGQFLRTNRALDRMGILDGRGRLVPESLIRMLQVALTEPTTERVRLQTSRGQRDLTATLTPTGDEQGTRVLAVQDITELRREEEEGGRRQRLEALGRMAAELAHEVRNPLGSIRLNACMLRDDLQDRDDSRTLVEQILAATAGLEGTVSNLLAFAAPARGQLRRFDLGQLVAETCSLFTPACKVRGVLLQIPESRPCEVQADPESLRQVLLNLLGNSLAATTDGGKIRVRTLAAADRVELIVEDDGCGIAAEDIARVFDPFFTRSEGGTGLGLSIVHRTVERHGGRIRVDSRSGHGTTVHVDLPRRTCQPIRIDEVAHA